MTTKDKKTLSGHITTVGVSMELIRKKLVEKKKKEGLTGNEIAELQLIKHLEEMKGRLRECLTIIDKA